jgi:hypothetical protein
VSELNEMNKPHEPWCIAHVANQECNCGAERSEVVSAPQPKCPECGTSMTWRVDVQRYECYGRQCYENRQRSVDGGARELEQAVQAILDVCTEDKKWSPWMQDGPIYKELLRELYETQCGKRWDAAKALEVKKRVEAALAPSREGDNGPK